MTQKIDTKMFGTVGVLMGGFSTEREISLMNGNKVYESLKRQGINAIAVDLDSPATVVNKIIDAKLDRAFPILHGAFGEDGTLQAILEGLTIPYVGSGVAASALSMDKMRCKWLWQGCGLPTPASMIVNDTTSVSEIADKLRFPLCVKPVHDGSSFGVSMVKTDKDYQLAFEQAKEFGDVMVEEWIEGEEYTVAILGTEALPAIHIKPTQGFYNYSAKYKTHSTQYQIPSGLSLTEEKILLKLAEDAFFACGCRDLARLDVMRDRQGNFYLLEINTIPGLVLYPLAAEAKGISFDQLTQTLLSYTFHDRKKQKAS